MLFREDLIMDQIEVSNQNELFQFTASILIEKGIVKSSYLKALTTRESRFPTGLLTKSGGVAIPHVDPTYINTDAVLAMRLKQPLIFHQMAEPDKTVDVQLIFFICSTGGTQQLSVLKQLMAILSDSQKLREIKDASDFADKLLTLKE